MSAEILKRNFRAAAIMRFRDQSASRLMWGEWWLKRDPHLKDETKAFLAAAEPSFEFKIRDILNFSVAHPWTTEWEREDFLTRTMSTLMLQERARLCHRWLIDCDHMLPPFANPAFAVRPLDPPNLKAAQIERWWNGGPVGGEKGFYINKAMDLIDGTYNAMITRLESLRATEASQRHYLPALRMGSR